MLENPQVRKKIIKEWRNLSPVRDIKIKIVSVHYIPKEKMRELNALRAEYWHKPTKNWGRGMQMVMTERGVFFDTMEEHGGFDWQTKAGQNTNATLKPSAGCWWIQKEEDAEEVNTTPANGDGAEREKFTLTNPTDEQEEILSAFLKGESLKIHAFAGTGKTATLTYLASQTEKRGLYFAFNQRVAKEADEKMPDNVKACTVHSVAYDWALNQYGRDKLLTRPAYKHFNSGAESSKIPDILKVIFSAPGEMEVAGNLNREVVRNILGTITMFCHSRDEEIQAKHFHRWIRDSSLRYRETLEKNEEFFLGVTAQIWEKMKDPNGEIPLGHDGYLKLWSLSSPQLNYDFLFFDEAQDLNPVMLNILDCYTGQKIIVGDGQQQVYLWRGAVNAMDNKFNARDLYLTKTFRFGEELAEIANNVLRFLGVKKKIVSATNSGTKIVVAGKAAKPAPNAYLFRGNMGLVGTAYSLFKQGKNYYIADPNRQIQTIVEDYFRLKDGLWGQSAVFIGYNSWGNAAKDARGGMEGTLLAKWVKFLGDHGEEHPKRVLECIKSSAAREGNTYPTLSTVHQAKGLEWNAVELGDDLIVEKSNKESEEEKAAREEELRVLYVALTRAKKTLILSPNLLRCCQSPAKQQNAKYARKDFQKKGKNQL